MFPVLGIRPHEFFVQFFGMLGIVIARRTLRNRADENAEMNVGLSPSRIRIARRQSLGAVVMRMAAHISFAANRYMLHRRPLEQPALHDHRADRFDEQCVAVHRPVHRRVTIIGKLLKRALDERCDAVKADRRRHAGMTQRRIRIELRQVPRLGRRAAEFEIALQDNFPRLHHRPSRSTVAGNKLRPAARISKASAPAMLRDWP